jgi:hypothetical protein
LLNKSKAEVVVVETAFDSNDKVVKGDFYGNALQAAAFDGDERSSSYWSARLPTSTHMMGSAAARCRRHHPEAHEKVAELLVRKGADLIAFKPKALTLLTGKLNN